MKMQQVFVLYCIDVLMCLVKRKQALRKNSHVSVWSLQHLNDTTLCLVQQSADQSLM